MEYLPTKGLMHEKICMIDEKIVYLGSANLTSESLVMHDNVLLGLYSKNAASHFLKHFNDLKMGKVTSSFTTLLNKQHLEMHFLPSKESLEFLIREIKLAKKIIYVALFTFTHPAILSELKEAKKRGVEVKVAADRYSSKRMMQKKDLFFMQSLGPQLFHHKWALIDHKTWIFGSANWTSSAFKKNEDYIAKLSPLKKRERKHLKKLWQKIEKETITPY